jgi:hypothetical protein
MDIRKYYIHTLAKITMTKEEVAPATLKANKIVIYIYAFNQLCQLWPVISGRKDRG